MEKPNKPQQRKKAKKTKLEHHQEETRKANHQKYVSLISTPDNDENMYMFKSVDSPPLTLTLIAQTFSISSAKTVACVL